MDQKTIDRLPLAPKGQQRIKVPDVPGLYLVLGTTKKSWRFQRDFNGKAVAMVPSIQMTLKEAKAWADEQRVLIARGYDPQQKAEQPSVTGPALWTVRQLMDARVKYATANKYSASAVKLMEAIRDRYLGLVPGLPALLVKDLTKSKCVELHLAISCKSISGKGAPTTANDVLKYLGAAWAYAKTTLDDHHTMPPDNPAKAPTRNPTRQMQGSISAADLPAWAEVVAGLPNPIRRHMHRIGLLTGLRWTTLRCLEWSWVEGNRLTVPPDKIKAGRGAVLPLSAALMNEVASLRKAVDFMSPGSRYLFPSGASHTATDDDRPLIARGWPGKLRRKTFRTQLELLGCPDNIAGTLLDHAAPGLKGNYVHRAEMFADLLKWQEKVSNQLVKLMK